MIRVQGLEKRYGRTQALDGLDLEVPEGAIYGFIGQNGAGKTTTLRILATLLVPDAGVAEIGGYHVVRRRMEVRRLIGYMPDFFGVYDDLRVSEYLEFYAGLQGIRGPRVRRLRDQLLELVDLADKRDEYVDSLSRGMQQRLCLARALIHDPAVLLLDEPASGLDPLARVEMRELLKELGRMGKTIVISSHILSELADMCTHIGMVHAGRLVRQGPVAQVLQESRGTARVLHVLRDAERAGAVLEEIEGVTGVTVEDGVVEFRFEGDAEGLAQVLAAVVSAGVPVVRFAEAGGTLEDVFLRLAREEVQA
ncbi:ABC transporter ATP-binding protein [Caldinitratiruptor microaerophilus]|uniref:ABC transporter n=1 Tax=Caldinitratiruptor microaerophilus TaxID=671077 RepID=A0AA35CNJ5_9FIRM|nr:ABC transporter ATP-binding protein [Caldinitratiruptor microaerophilus]BDG60852.1 ABC transporter [Caldinitratiruptor microaerophilus]